MINNAKNTAVMSGHDLYITTDFSSTQATEKPEGWIIGKIMLFYKDGILEPKYDEYPYPVKIIEIFKKIPIIKIKFDDGYKYSILKNKHLENPKIVYDTLKEVERYINGFDYYSSTDRKYFLL